MHLAETVKRVLLMMIITAQNYTVVSMVVVLETAGHLQIDVIPMNVYRRENPAVKDMLKKRTLRIVHLKMLDAFQNQLQSQNAN